MKRFLIVSDTHGYNVNFVKAVKAAGKVDAVIHCGDIEGSEYYLSQTAGAPIYMVQGNNDYYSDIPPEMVFEFGSRKFWVIHGHRYHVNRGLDWLMPVAVSHGAHIVCYGHSHRPSIKQMLGIWFINPGSLTYPRQENRLPSFAVLEIDEADKISAEIHYIED